MRRINAITFLNYFVSGALTLLIPLLLLTKHVNVAEIGLVLSILPLVFLVARLLFSAIADYIGWSHVFVLINWPSAFFSTLIYYFSSTLPFFVLGKLVEALGNHPTGLCAEQQFIICRLIRQVSKLQK